MDIGVIKANLTKLNNALELTSSDERFTVKITSKHYSLWIHNGRGTSSEFNSYTEIKTLNGALITMRKLINELAYSLRKE